MTEPTPEPERPARRPQLAAVPAGLRRIGRQQFVTAFAKAWQPGDHVALVGPTGRGKSYTLGQVLPFAVRFHDAVIVSPKGADPAYQALGRKTTSWPPRQSMWDQFGYVLGLKSDHEEDRPKVWRLEVPIRKVADFGKLQATFGSLLASTLARPEQPKKAIVVVLDDSRLLSDFLKLRDLIVANMIASRSKRVSLVNNFQAPRWVPRECLDQATHFLCWRNRDLDVVKRLAELSGDLDLKTVTAAIQGLGYHELLWINGRTDEALIVGAD